MGAKSKFVWHDLMAADVEGAKKFYGEVFGWSFRRGDNDPYEHISAGTEHIGGIVTLDKNHGVPPHWIGYIGVDDVDASLSAVQKAGGKVFVPKTKIPEVGEFAVAADRQGAVFSPFHYTGKDADQPETNLLPKPFTFTWDELLTQDQDDGAKFYAEVFGWGLEKLEMQDYGGYILLKRTGVKDEMGADKSAGGVAKAPPGVPVSFWLPYISVPSADDLVAKAKRLGGQVTAGPMDIPNVGRFATLLDPQNAAFAILQPSR